MSLQRRPERITLQDVTYFAPDDPMFDMDLLDPGLPGATPASKAFPGVRQQHRLTAPLSRSFLSMLHEAMLQVMSPIWTCCSFFTSRASCSMPEDQGATRHSMNLSTLFVT